MASMIRATAVFVIAQTAVMMLLPLPKLVPGEGGEGDGTVPFVSLPFLSATATGHWGLWAANALLLLLTAVQGGDDRATGMVIFALLSLTAALVVIVASNTFGPLLALAGTLLMHMLMFADLGRLTLGGASIGDVFVAAPGRFTRARAAREWVLSLPAAGWLVLGMLLSFRTDFFQVLGTWSAHAGWDFRPLRWCACLLVGLRLGSVRFARVGLAGLALLFALLDGIDEYLRRDLAAGVGLTALFPWAALVIRDRPTDSTMRRALLGALLIAIVNCSPAPGEPVAPLYDLILVGLALPTVVFCVQKLPPTPLQPVAFELLIFGFIALFPNIHWLLGLLFGTVVSLLGAGGPRDPTAAVSVSDEGGQRGQGGGWLLLHMNFVVLTLQALWGGSLQAHSFHAHAVPVDQVSRGLCVAWSFYLIFHVAWLERDQMVPFTLPWGRSADHIGTLAPNSPPWGAAEHEEMQESPQAGGAGKTSVAAL